MDDWNPIRAPCPLQAEGLRFEDLPDGYCTHCRETVVDLSTLTERQARRVMARDEAACVAVRMHAGRPIFRRSRVAAVLTALLVPLVARPEVVDIDVRTGVESSSSSEQSETVEFGQGSVTSSRDGLCHPKRHPHGPSGSAWISVGRGLKSAWKRVVLTCSSDGARLLRERRDFPEGTTRLQFTALPNDVDCDVKLRGGEPNATVHIETEASEPTPP